MSLQSLKRQVRELEERLGGRGIQLTWEEFWERLKGPPGESDEYLFIRFVNLIGLEAVLEASWIEDNDEETLRIYNHGIKRRKR